MTWVRLDDHFYTDPKMVGLSVAAGWLWVCALAYCNANLTDGFVPAGMLASLAKANTREANRSARELVEAGLWSAEEKGHRIHNFLKWNPAASDVRAKREGATKRMQKHRKGTSATEADEGCERDEGEMKARCDRDSVEMKATSVGDSDTKTIKTEPKSNGGDAPVTALVRAFSHPIPSHTPNGGLSDAAPRVPTPPLELTPTIAKGPEPKAKAAKPKPEPMPWTIGEMILALSERSNGRVVTALDSRLAPSLTLAIREAASQEFVLDDLRLVGEWVGAGGLSYLTDGLDARWMATTGNLVSALAKARLWRDGGRRPVTNQGNRSVDPPAPPRPPLAPPPPKPGERVYADVKRPDFLLPRGVAR